MKFYYTATITKQVEGEIEADSEAEARAKIMNGEGYDSENTDTESYERVDSIHEGAF